MISLSNRLEFEELGVDEVRKRIEASIYHGDKLREAREWRDENNPAWVSARAAQKAVTIAKIALIISVLSLVVSLLPHIQKVW